MNIVPTYVDTRIVKYFYFKNSGLEDFLPYNPERTKIFYLTINWYISQRVTKGSRENVSYC